MADLFDDDDAKKLEELAGATSDALDPAALEDLIAEASAKGAEDAASGKVDPAALEELEEKSAAPSMEIGDLEMAPSKMDIGEISFPDSKEESSSAGRPSGAGGEIYSEDDVFGPAGEPSPMEIGEIAVKGDPAAPAPPAKPSTALPVPEPSDMAGEVMEGGDQKKPFGVQNNMQDLMASAQRAGELWDKQAKAPGGPGANEKRFRDEFSQGGEDIDRALRMAAVMKSLVGDDAGYGERAKYLMGRQKEFDQGLAQARAADRGKQRISRAMAEQAALAGISPESAANLQSDDQAIELIKASQGGIGARLRGQDQAAFLGVLKPTQQTWESEFEASQRATQGDANRANQLEYGRIMKGQKGGAGGGGRFDPTSLVSQQYHQPREAVAAFLAGDMNAIPEELRDSILSSVENYKMMGGKKRMELANKLEAATGTEYRKPEEAARVAAMNPEKRTKYATELTEIGIPLDSAWRAWRSMSPRAKNNLVKLGMGKGADLAQFMNGDADQRAAGAVWRQISNGAKAISGAAISGAESPRLSQGFGAAMEGGQMFLSPEALEGWLTDMVHEYRSKVAIVERNFPGIFGSVGGQ